MLGILDMDAVCVGDIARSVNSDIGAKHILRMLDHDVHPGTIFEPQIAEQYVAGFSYVERLNETEQSKRQSCNMSPVSNQNHSRHQAAPRPSNEPDPWMTRPSTPSNAIHV
ncbi:hypothetical protein MLD38_026722 [Melastoma candidum]|uniref:Uncharacterized protein n=1 Tax=Melastoma candidum TaxID=119954 RepID=A0ACB9P2E8_9MYRT|nr:hypothetical protein MLD38_026722 [Melastoma candidum]